MRTFFSNPSYKTSGKCNPKSTSAKCTQGPASYLTPAPRATSWTITDMRSRAGRSRPTLLSVLRTNRRTTSRSTVSCEILFSINDFLAKLILPFVDKWLINGNFHAFVLFIKKLYKIINQSSLNGSQPHRKAAGYMPCLNSDKKSIVV